MGATAILDCKNLEILTMGTVKKMRDRARFGPNRSNHCRDMAIFWIFPRRQPSVILDLRCVCSDHPRMEFGGLYHRAKFGWNVNMTLQWNSIFREIFLITSILSTNQNIRKIVHKTKSKFTEVNKKETETRPHIPRSRRTSINS